VRIVGEAATIKTASALLSETAYDLVFLDVHLIGGSGFDLVPRVRPDASIVFVTAHDAFALRAFEVNALDYLLKPIAVTRLATTIRRILSAAPATPPSMEPKMDPAPVSASPGCLNYDDTIMLRTGLRALFVRLERIATITAQDNYTEVMLVDGTRAFMRKSLQTWEDTLPPTHFMRVHRTQILNLAQVIRYERDAEERTRLFVVGLPSPVSASRHRWSELRERLAALRPTP
jgi:two-component system LytT family response regulator